MLPPGRIGCAGFFANLNIEVGDRTDAQDPLRLSCGFFPAGFLKNAVRCLETEICALRSSMSHYTFRIRQGTYSSDLAVDLLDDTAAWHEAASVCSDLVGDTVAGLGENPEWRLEVADNSGAIRHLFRLTAETFRL
jgi:hypothetical protein